MTLIRRIWEPVMQKYDGPPFLVLFEEILNLVNVLYIINDLPSVRIAVLQELQYIKSGSGIKRSLIKYEAQNDASCH